LAGGYRDVMCSAVMVWANGESDFPSLIGLLMASTPECGPNNQMPAVGCTEHPLTSGRWCAALRLVQQ
jgi:hypothetical protein